MKSTFDNEIRGAIKKSKGNKVIKASETTNAKGNFGKAKAGSGTAADGTGKLSFKSQIAKGPNTAKPFKKVTANPKDTIESSAYGMEGSTSEEAFDRKMGVAPKRMKGM